MCYPKIGYFYADSAPKYSALSQITGEGKRKGPEKKEKIRIRVRDKRKYRILKMAQIS